MKNKVQDQISSGKLQNEKPPKTNHPLQNYYSHIYKSYDLINTLFTFGCDRRWRNHLILECMKSHPAEVLDLCCGTGDLAIGLKKKGGWPVQVTAYDRNPDMLGIAVQKAEQHHQNIHFMQGDAACMPFKDGEFDAIMIGFGFRNLTWENEDRERHISEISRIMKKDAQLFILESASPENPIIRFLYKIYLKIVLIPLGGLISGNLKAYHYLAGSSAGFYPYMTLKKMLAPHHLHLERHRTYMFGSVNILIARKLN